MKLVDPHLRKARRHRGDPLVPIRHRDRDPVGLGGRGQVMLRPARRQLERELQHAVHAVPGHHGLLHHELPIGALEHPTADRRVLALGVLANDHAVDVARHRGHPRHQTARPQVHVLVELATKFDQRAPQRHMIGYARRPADRAEEDRVVPANQIAPIGRHHRAVPLEVIAAGEVEVVELEPDVEAARGRIEHPQALGHHFAPDAVAGDHRDSMPARHLVSSTKPASTFDRSFGGGKRRRAPEGGRCPFVPIGPQPRGSAVSAGLRQRRSAPATPSSGAWPCPIFARCSSQF